MAIFDSFRSFLVPASLVSVDMSGVMPAGDAAREEAAIGRLFERYRTTFSTHDADGWMDLWDEEGVQLPPDLPMNVGKQAIRQSNYEFIKDDSRSWVFDYTLQEVLLFGPNSAVARGVYTYAATSKVGKPPLTMDGKFMSVLTRKPGGEWLFFRDCFNSNVART